jgi:hypothetical protein
MKRTHLLLAAVAALALTYSTPVLAADETPRGKGDCLRLRDGSGPNCNPLAAGKQNKNGNGTQQRKRDGTGPNCKK